VIIEHHRTETIGEIDRSLPTPLYYQLKQVLLRAIRAGEFDPAEPLPSESDLESWFGVSRITVRRAMTELATDGYIRRESGRGTFVIPEKIKWTSSRLGHTSSGLEKLGYEVTTTVLEARLRSAPKQVARKLELEDGTPLFFLRRLIYVDDEPLLLTRGYHDYGPDVTLTKQQLESTSLFVLMEDYYSEYRAEKTIGVTFATDEEADHLNIELNAPLLLVESLVRSQDGRARAFVKSLYRADRYKYRHIEVHGSFAK
jgi:GntR family transcriptional regulator